MTAPLPDDLACMRRALELAARGLGAVEPNPLVGCVIVAGGRIVGEGFHGRYGGPHAEIEALRAAGSAAAGGTMYVTLEPCCHHGKTPPCSQAVIAAQLARVVIAQQDPFPQVAGGGLAQLRSAGVAVEVGLLGEEAARLNRAYLKLLRSGRPWVIAKWAMTLDGRIASRAGSSQWISSVASREVVHQLRGRVDGVMVGSQTALSDDPALTARPAGPRVATRVVVDSQASLPAASQLCHTAGDVPVLVAVSAAADERRQRSLASAGCEVLPLLGADHAARLGELLDELGRRRWTNLLVEGGGRLLGALFDARMVDEVHAFVAPRIIGGAAAPGPVGGLGLAEMASAWELSEIAVSQTGPDVYLRGVVAHDGPDRQTP